MDKHNRKVIRITEQELHRIVYESIKSIIGEEVKPFIGLNLRNIPIEDFKKAYRDYSEMPQPKIFGDPLYSGVHIKEAVSQVYPPDSICIKIANKYGLPNKLVQKVEFYHKIFVYIITANIGGNIKLITDDMENLGYFCSSQKPVVIEGMDFTALQFEPTSQLQDDETDTVRSSNRYLFHWTTKYLLPQILKEGLTPRCNNTFLKFPPRIYLMDEYSDYEQIISLGKQLCLYNKDNRNNGEYIILTIDLSKVGENVRFYYDPNCPIAYYTEQPIPPQAIEVADEYKFKTKLV